LFVFFGYCRAFWATIPYGHTVASVNRELGCMVAIFASLLGFLIEHKPSSYIALGAWIAVIDTVSKFNLTVGLVALLLLYISFRSNWQLEEKTYWLMPASHKEFFWLNIDLNSLQCMLDLYRSALEKKIPIAPSLQALFAHNRTELLDGFRKAAGGQLMLLRCLSPADGLEGAQLQEAIRIVEEFSKWAEGK
jgi:hypothetical protein